MTEKEILEDCKRKIKKAVSDCFLEEINKLPSRPQSEQNAIGNLLTILEMDIKKQIAKL